MTDDHPAPESDKASPATERTVAFYAAPNAATLLLEPTITALISARQIERGLIDLSTAAGLAVASAFRAAGVPYDSLEYGQEDHVGDGAPSERDAAEIRLAAEERVELDVGSLGTVDANIVLVPAAIGSDGPLMDFSQGTLIGAVMSQLEQAQRPLLVIVPPERGLQAAAGGAYQRSILHVAGDATD